MNERLFSTSRLYFREFTLGDEASLLALNSDEEVVQYTGNPAMKNLDEAHDVLVNIILPQYKMQLGRWAVHLKEDDAFIGWCGLKEIEGHVDLGYRFFQKYWGKGYATEAANATLDYGFNTLHLEKIIAHAMVMNKGSIKILDKILNRTGIATEDGKEIQCFEITRDQFLQKQKTHAQ